MTTCPAEILEYSDIAIFNKDKMLSLEKEPVIISVIGEVMLDSDERKLLCLPLKFAVRRRLDTTDMTTDLQMSLAKVRYQL